MKPEGLWTGYTLKHGPTCPHCNSYDIAEDTKTHHQSSHIWINAKCNECLADWVSAYRLVGHSRVES